MKKEKTDANDFFRSKLADAQQAETSHVFNAEKQPPIPAGIDEVILRKGRAVTKSPKTPRHAKRMPSSSKARGLVNHLKYSQIAKTPLFLIDQREAFHSKRIKNLQIKEQLLAARTLKSIGRETQDWIEQRFRHRITDKSKENKAIKEEPVVQRPDRQFLIERVIRYLTDV